MTRSHNMEPKWKCLHAHDRCDQMLPGPNCPFCVKSQPLKTKSAKRAADDVHDIFVVTASNLEMEFTKSWVCAAFGTEAEALDYLTREARPEYNLTVSKIRLGASPSVEEREAEQDELDRIAGDAQRAARST